MANPVLKILLVLTSKLTLQAFSFPTSMVNVSAGDWNNFRGPDKVYMGDELSHSLSSFGQGKARGRG